MKLAKCPVGRCSRLTLYVSLVLSAPAAMAATANVGIAGHVALASIYQAGTFIPADAEITGINYAFGEEPPVEGTGVVTSSRSPLTDDPIPLPIGDAIDGQWRITATAMEPEGYASRGWDIAVGIDLTNTNSFEIDVTFELSADIDANADAAGSPRGSAVAWGGVQGSVYSYYSPGLPNFFDRAFWADARTTSQPGTGPGRDTDSSGLHLVTVEVAPGQRISAAIYGALGATSIVAVPLPPSVGLLASAFGFIAGGIARARVREPATSAAT